MACYLRVKQLCILLITLGNVAQAMLPSVLDTGHTCPPRKVVAGRYDNNTDSTNYIQELKISRAEHSKCLKSVSPANVNILLLSKASLFPSLGSKQMKWIAKKIPWVNKSAIFYLDKMNIFFFTYHQTSACLLKEYWNV